MEGQTRIMMWYIPRSLSSCFLRAMSNKANTKVINEAYFCYYTGTENESIRYERNELAALKTPSSYREAKEHLEEDYLGKTCVFAKTAAVCVGKKRSIADVMPKDYVNTFILRKPEKCVLSMYNMNTKQNIPNWDFFVPEDVDYKYLYEVFEYVTMVMGQEAIVVEADELQENPEGIMKMYCKKTGIEFEEAMVNWAHPMPDIGPFEGGGAFYQNAINSTGFMKPKPVDEKAVYALPEDVKKLIEHNRTFYDKMYPFRLGPE